MSEWKYPLKKANCLPDELGTFGANRKHHTHEGIDLYGDKEDPVFAVEDGTVVAIEWFTGELCPDYPSPWWNNTQALLIEGESGVVVYGEILIQEHLTVGTKVSQGDLLGKLESVLKVDKGRPMTMLHLELHKHGTTQTYAWEHGVPRPMSLLDPTVKIERSFYKIYNGDILNARYSSKP